MAREYAARNRAPKRKKAGLPGWIWMIVGLSLGLAVAVFVYIGRPMQPLPGQAAVATRDVEAEPSPEADDRPVRAESRKAPGAKPAAAKATPADDRIAIPPREKPRFTFYELLPNQEVVIPSDGPAPKPAAAANPTAAATATATATAAPTESYIIQVASYRSATEADHQKAKLAMLGIESRIEKVTIDNKDTYYRVRIGPERDLNRARDTLAQLESNGVQGLLVKVR